MGAYNRTNGEPCCASKTLLQDILRKEWGFDGYVVSDCGAICDIHEHHKVTKSPPESAALAVHNGCELNCGAVYPSLVAAVQMGLIDEAEIDIAVGRLMTARFRLGMFDPPSQVPYTQIPPEVVNCEKHRSLAREMARESIVLLKNENGLLPLDKQIRSIAVVGPTAFSPRALIGNYYGFSPRVTTILEGVVGAVSPGTQVNYAKGCPLADEPPAGTDMIDCGLEDVDAIVAVLGNTAELEGEEGAVADSDGGGDRSQIGLPGRQEELLRDLHATGKPVVLVLTGGSPIAIGWAAKNIPAILMAWYPGEAGGEAVADVLFGDYNPSGRLPVTFVKSLDQVPPFEDYSMEGRTYRFMREEPLYRFGYGLSYTKFEYSNLRLSKDRIGPDESFTVTVEVENVGTSVGDEVVQLYVRDVESSAPVPIHHLEGIRRLNLKPGEKREVSFALHPEQLVVYGDDGRDFVEPGEFVVSVGGRQPGAPGQAETQYRGFRVGMNAHAIESKDG
jgi:beta-glucosidase